MIELNALEMIYIIVSWMGTVEIQFTQHGFGWTLGVGDGQGGLRAAVHGVKKSRTRLSD